MRTAVETPPVRAIGRLPLAPRKPDPSPDLRFRTLLESLARLKTTESGGDSIGEFHRALGEAERAQRAVDELSRMFEDAFRRALGS